MFTLPITIDSDYHIFEFWMKKTAEFTAQIKFGVSYNRNIESFNWTTANSTIWTWTKHTLDLSEYIGQTVYIAMYYNGSFDSYLYLDDFGFAYSPYCIAPTTQASNLTVTNLASTTLKLNWTRGNGNSVLVVAKQNSSVNYAPLNGTGYEANSVFGQGNTTGTGNFIVYNGTGTSVNISGLTNSAAYDFYVYEYNTSSNCYLTPAVTVSATTLIGGVYSSSFSENFEGTFLPAGWVKQVTSPNDITKSTDQNHTASGLNSCRFSSYTSASNYNQYLYTVPITIEADYSTLEFWHRKSNASATETLEYGIGTTTNPANYTWTSVSLSGYEWTKKTVNLSAYAGQTVMIAFHYYGNYQYYVYLDDLKFIYNCNSPSTQASSLSVSNLLSNTLTLNWTRGNGNSVLVLAKKGTSVNADPISGIPYTASSEFGTGSQIGTGNYVVYNGTGSSVELTGLLASNSYSFAVYEYNTAQNCYKTPGATFTTTTPCGIINSSEFNINFEGTFPPTCWTKDVPSVTDITQSNTRNHTNGGTYSCKFASNTSVSNDYTQYLISIPIYIEENYSQLEFWHIGYSGGQTSYYGIATSTNFSAYTWHPFSSTTTWQKERFDFEAFVGQTVYLIFKYDGYYSNTVFIDDIKFNNYLSCNEPTIQTSNITWLDVSNTSLQFGWTRGNGNNVLVVAKQNFATDAEPQSSISYNANSVFGLGDELGSGNFVVYNGTGNSVNVTGLDHGGKYYFSVYEYNSSNNCYLTPGATINLQANCSSLSNFRWFENIENDGLFPNCWTTDYDYYLTKWEIKESTTYSHSGEYYAYIDGSSNAKLISPQLDFTGITSAELTFWYKMEAYNGYQDELRILYKKDYSNTWTQIPGAQFTTNVTDWTKVTISLPTPLTNLYFIAFEGDMNGGLGVNVDDISISKTVTCTTPTTQVTNLNYSLPTTNSFSVNWVRGSGDKVLIVANEYENSYLEPANGTEYTANSNFGSGSDLGNGNFVVYNGTENSFTLTGLDYGKNYYLTAYEYNSATNCYLLPGVNLTATTSCPTILSSQFNEDFESNLIPSCWIKQLISSSDVYTQAIVGPNYTGNYVCILHSSGDDVDNNVYLFTIPITIEPGFSNFEFYNKSYYQTNLQYFEVGVGTSTNPQDFSWVPITGLTTSWQKVSIDLTAYIGQTIRIGFKYYETDYYYLRTYIDNLKFTGSLCTKPTVQSSNVYANNITSNSLKLNWTRGTGNAVLVLARENEPVNTEPSDGQSYLANGNFGLGDEIGTDNFVVYNGTENYANITELNQGTTYYFSVYEYNSSENCYLNVGASVSQEISCYTELSSEFTEDFENHFLPYCWDTIVTSQFDIRYGYSNHTPNGSNCAEFYSPNKNAYIFTKQILIEPEYSKMEFWQKKAFSSESTLEYGISLSKDTLSYTWSEAPLSNLTWQKTTVDISAYIGHNVYIGFRAKGSYTYIDDLKFNFESNCVPPTTPPTNVDITNISSNSLQLNWNRGNGNSVIVLAKQVTPIDSKPVNEISYSANSNFGEGSEIGTGNYVVYIGDGTTVEVTNLQPGYEYYFEVFEFFVAENCYANSGGITSASTLCSIFSSADFSEDFEGGIITSCYTRQDATPDLISISQLQNHTQGGVNSCFFNLNTPNSHQFLYTTPIYVDPDFYELEFWLLKDNGYQQSPIFYTITTESPEFGYDNWTQVVYKNTWTQIKLDLSAYISQTIYIGFKFDNFYGTKSWLDDIKFTTKGICTPPTIQSSNIYGTNITENSLTLNWTRGNGDKVIVLASAKDNSYSNIYPNLYNGYQYTGNPNFGSGYELEEGYYVVYSGTGTNVNVTGLISGTNYHFKVYEYNSETNCYLYPSADKMVKTNCEYEYNLPFNEGFEGTVFPPTCWDVNDGETGLGNNSQWIASDDFHSGNQAAIIVWEELENGSFAEDWLVTPLINLPSSEISLSYWEKELDNDDWNTSYSVKISTTSQIDHSSFTNIITYYEPDFSNVYTQRSIDLSSYAGQSVYIAFVMKQNNGDLWTLDDIKIEALAPIPTFFSTTVSLDFGEVEVGSTSGELQFSVEGHNLTQNAIINAPTDFLISKTSGTGFTGSLSFEPDNNGNVNSTVFVKFSPLTAQNYNDNISLEYLSINSLINVQGIGTPATSPFINISEIGLNFGDVKIGQNSDELNFTINGQSLTENIEISSVSDFYITTISETNYSQNIILSPVDGNINSTIYVRFSPLIIQNYNYNITITSEIEEKSVNVNGRGINDVNIFENITDETSITIHPNPSNGIFNITVENNMEKYVYEVVDITGKIIIEKSNEVNNKFVIDLSEYPSSIYILRLKFKDSCINKQIIKK